MHDLCSWAILGDLKQTKEIFREFRSFGGIEHCPTAVFWDFGDICAYSDDEDEDEDNDDNDNDNNRTCLYIAKVSIDRKQASSRKIHDATYVTPGGGYAPSHAEHEAEDNLLAPKHTAFPASKGYSQ